MIRRIKDWYRYTLLDWLRRPVIKAAVAWLTWRRVPVLMNVRMEQPLHIVNMRGGFFNNLDITNVNDDAQPAVLYGKTP